MAYTLRTLSFSFSLLWPFSNIFTWRPRSPWPKTYINLFLLIYFCHFTMNLHPCKLHEFWSTSVFDVFSMHVFFVQLLVLDLTPFPQVFEQRPHSDHFVQIGHGRTSQTVHLSVSPIQSLAAPLHFLDCFFRPSPQVDEHSDKSFHSVKSQALNGQCCSWCVSLSVRFSWHICVSITCLSLIQSRFLKCLE